MGQLSAFGCIATIVLLMQLGLHTQLLRTRSGIIMEDSNHTEDDSLTSTSDQSLSLKSRIISVISPTGTRNKRFLHSEENSVDSSADAALVVSTAVDIPVPLADVSTKLPPSAWEGVPQSLTISNYYNGEFILPNAHLCKRNKNENVALVVLVPSAVQNFRQRESVRQTWGSFALRRDVVIGFMIGDPNLSQADSSVMESFRKEIDLFEDIIIADFKDSYRNLTLKALYMAEWSSKYCSNARFFMKTDDDVFLNVPQVLDFIAKVNKSDTEQPKIYGNVFSGHLPKRDATHKHFVNYQVYPHEIRYPNFTSGPAYLISSPVLRPLLKEAVKLPLFNLEDVLLTGFAASVLNIPRVNVTQFRNERENPFDMPACKVVNIIAGMTDGSSSQIYHVWYNYLMGRLICPHLKKQR